MFIRIRALIYAIFYFLYFLIRYNLFRNYKATIVAAMDNKNYAIGFEGDLCYHIKSDMKHFKELTYKAKDLFNSILDIKNILICGRKTFESLHRKNLPGRHMIVLTKDPIVYFNQINSINIDSNKLEYKIDENLIITKNIVNEYIIFVKNLNEIYTALRILTRIDKGFGNVFVIGGGQIYKEFLTEKIKGIKVKNCILTTISSESEIYKNKYNGRFDTVFPFNKIIDDFKCNKSKYLEEGVSVFSYIRR